jgi:hypothetical protein
MGDDEAKGAIKTRKLDTICVDSGFSSEILFTLLYVCAQGGSLNSICVLVLRRRRRDPIDIG